MYREQLTHGNPILIELAAGLDNGDREDAFRIWIPRANQPGAFFEYYVKFESESCSTVENPLDILDAIL
jgi:hypothetical protein